MPIHRIFTLFLTCTLMDALYARTEVSTIDILHFFEAYDHIVATTDTALQRNQLHTYFIDKASPGQRAMFVARRYTPDEYLEAIRRYPRFWASVRKT
ncbi:MAG: hypothetical protein R2817_07635 [Flavobacteriales bacterium]